MHKLLVKCLHLTLLLFCSYKQGVFADQNPIKVLHFTFNKGCAKEVEGIAKELSLSLETWYIPALPPRFFDGITSGNALYNIGHERAERIWNLHRSYFEQFDVIVTSDTAPLSRIFLQNGFSKKLVIWICNRFDYSDTESLDCNFPDEEYYSLFEKATHQTNVSIIAYTAFEHYYAQSKGIHTGSLIIAPCSVDPQEDPSHTAIPSHIVKENTFFLPPYHNELQYIDFSQLCRNLKIPNYCGHYNGSADLKRFKGIIHLPYAWSNLALFENMALGIPYFVPSRTFFIKLASSGNYFHTESYTLLNENLFDLSEWYSPENQEAFIYFDSWDDLKEKTESLPLDEQREKIRNHWNHHKEVMLSRWETVFKIK